MEDNQVLGQIVESCVKAIASQIPIVSGVSSLYADWKNSTEFSNIYHLIDCHARTLEKLQEKVDLEFLRSDDYAYILHKTILKARNEIRENKRKLFAEFLTQSCLTKNSENTDKLIFLEMLDKIEIEHIMLLKYLTQKKNELKDGWIIDFSLSRETGMKEERIRFLVHYFISIGLILDYNDFEIKDDGNLYSETRFFVSDLGINLLDFLR